jgi:hypothetical protein
MQAAKMSYLMHYVTAYPDSWTLNTESFCCTRWLIVIGAGKDSQESLSFFAFVLCTVQDCKYRNSTKLTS